MSKHTIQDKVVLIAGGAKNLGGLIARDLAQHGARAVAIHYNSAASKADADATAGAIRAAGAVLGEVAGDQAAEVLGAAGDEDHLAVDGVLCHGHVSL